MAGPFQPKLWLDSPSTITPISAAALNDLENRINTQVASVGSDGKIGGPGGSSIEGTIETNVNKDAANGYAGLDSGGKLNAAEFPYGIASISQGAGNSTITDWASVVQNVNTGLFFQSINSSDPFLRGNLAPNKLGTNLLANPAFSTAGSYTANQSGPAVNIYHASSWVESTGTVNATAFFAGATGMSVWGLNPQVYSFGGSAAAAIGMEIDFGNFSTAATTIAVASNGQVLPQVTINVASTAGAAATGTLTVGGAIISYTGTTGTTFTGCTVQNGSTATLGTGNPVNYSLGGTATGMTVVAHGASAGGSPGSQFISFDASSAGDSCNYGLLIAGANNTTGKQPINLGAIYLNGLFATSGFLVNNGNYTAIFQVTNATATEVINVGSGTYTTFARFAGTATNGLDLSTATISGSAIHLGDTHNIVLGSTTGTKLGTNSNQKLGFWNATPIVRPARAGQLTDNTGGAVSSTLAAGITDAVAKNAIASIAAKVNALELALSAAGGGSGLTA